MARTKLYKIGKLASHGIHIGRQNEANWKPSARYCEIVNRKDYVVSTRTKARNGEFKEDREKKALLVYLALIKIMCAVFRYPDHVSRKSPCCSPAKRNFSIIGQAHLSRCYVYHEDCVSFKKKSCDNESHSRRNVDACLSQRNRITKGIRGASFPVEK